MYPPCFSVSGDKVTIYWIQKSPDPVYSALLQNKPSERKTVSGTDDRSKWNGLNGLGSAYRGADIFLFVNDTTNNIWVINQGSVISLTNSIATFVAKSSKSVAGALGSNLPRTMSDAVRVIWMGVPDAGKASGNLEECLITDIET
jgi:hypothetical protein